MILKLTDDKKTLEYIYVNDNKIVYFFDANSSDDNHHYTYIKVEDEAIRVKELSENIRYWINNQRQPDEEPNRYSSSGQQIGLYHGTNGIDTYADDFKCQKLLE